MLARLEPATDPQKRLLEAEGIVIDASGKISLECYRWKIKSAKREDNEAED